MSGYEVHRFFVFALWFEMLIIVHDESGFFKGTLKCKGILKFCGVRKNKKGKSFERC